MTTLSYPPDDVPNGTVVKLYIIPRWDCGELAGEGRPMANILFEDNADYKQNKILWSELSRNITRNPNIKPMPVEVTGVYRSTIFGRTIRVISINIT